MTEAERRLAQVIAWAVKQNHDLEQTNGDEQYVALGSAMDSLNAILEGTPLPVDSDTSTTGVWALIDRDHSDSITAVYPTELEALRILNGRGYGRVYFLTFGYDARGEVVS